MARKRNSPLITLLTDFGDRDWFVGSMKGVIASICPSAAVCDITHRISPGDIREASFVLKCAYHYFPRGTVHIAVVDPGVGTERSALVLSGGGYFFVAPDNGVLTWIFHELPDGKVYRAVRRDLFLREISSTFQGRDVFAPLGARLANGFPPGRVGPRHRHPVRFPLTGVIRRGEKKWSAGVIYVDTFGNAITSFSGRDAEAEILKKANTIRLTVSGRHFTVPLARSYAAVGKGKTLAVWGSSGQLELAVNRGSASERLSLKPGDRLLLEVVN